MCSPYRTLKVSQSWPVGGTMGRRDNVSSSTELGKQQDSKYRQPSQHGLNSVCWCSGKGLGGLGRLCSVRGT